jgi:cytochrome c oxidase subunit IV
MSSKDGLGYSVFRIWIILLVLTTAEVVWGMFLRPPTFPRWLLWGGLVTFALIKGLYILMYFMHMKYERFIVWSLILPTPFLVAVVLCALMPDVSFKDDLRDHPVGEMLVEGQVVDVLEYQHPPFGHHGEGHGGEHGAGAAASHGAQPAEAH